MSKILNNKFEIPKGVSCEVVGNDIIVKGDFGDNLLNMSKHLSLDNEILILDKNISKAMFNTYVKLIKNALLGSLQGFKTVINFQGVGYKVERNADCLNFSLGYSHKIPMLIPASIECEIKSNTQMVVKSASKQLLGDFVSKILKLRKPNPYKLKGVLTEGQFVRRKEGKK